MRGCRAFRHSRRSARMSSRPHSEASSVFFEGEARLHQQPGQRRRVGLHTHRLQKPGSQFRHGHVGLRLDPGDDPVALRLKRAATRRTTLACRRRRTRDRHPPRQLHRKTGTDPEPSRRLAARTAGVDAPLNTIPEIRRVRPSHDPPPSTVNHKSKPLGIPIPPSRSML